MYEHDGRLVLVELKTRRRATAYFSDVIELSAQRLAIEGKRGERVADDAFVVVQPPLTGRCVTVRVRLLPAAEVVRLAQRYSAILSGRAPPVMASRKELCAGCAFQGQCRHTSRPETRGA